MNGIDISVIIPSYKPKDYLWECLSSLKRQTFSLNRFEIILILNGCKEPYESQINEWMHANSLNNLVIIQTDLGGVSYARNLGLDRAQGDYITFLDDDDYISPTFLQELFELACPQTVPISYKVSFEDSSISQKMLQFGDKEYDYCVKHHCDSINSRARKFFSGPWQKLLHKDIIGNRRFDIRFKNGEDNIFLFLISDRIDKVCFTSKNAIYFRRLRLGSAMTKKRSRMGRILNDFKSISQYIKIYIKGGYSFYFFVTRILAEIKCMFNILIGKY